MLNPALYLAVFYVVFQVVLDNGLPYFTIYLLSGLLVWNLFATALSGAVASIVVNGGIVKKVDFPREVLPLAAVGTALVNFLLQSAVLVLALAIFRYGVDWGYLPLLVPAILALALLAAGIGMIAAAVNVFVRDAQHLVELALLAWFWFTPVVWYYGLVGEIGDSGRARWLFVNPVTSVTLTSQRAIYGRVRFRDGSGVHAILPDYSVPTHLAMVGAVGVAGVVLFLVGEWVFGKLDGSFAEEL
jgi:ABC-2 type transport system permease protein